MRSQFYIGAWLALIVVVAGGAVWAQVVALEPSPASRAVTIQKAEQAQYGLGDAVYAPPRQVYAEDRRFERDTASAIKEWAQAKEESARSIAREKLASALAQQFDDRQKRREQEIADIEARLQKLRETLRKRADAKQTIVSSRLEQLLREAEGLGWGDGESARYRATSVAPVPVAPLTAPRSR
jgi:hypothetical protein